MKVFDRSLFQSLAGLSQPKNHRNPNRKGWNQPGTLCKQSDIVSPSCISVDRVKSPVSATWKPALKTRGVDRWF